MKKAIQIFLCMGLMLFVGSSNLKTQAQQVLIDVVDGDIATGYQTHSYFSPFEPEASMISISGRNLIRYVLVISLCLGLLCGVFISSNSSTATVKIVSVNESRFSINCQFAYRVSETRPIEMEKDITLRKNVAESIKIGKFQINAHYLEPSNDVPSLSVTIEEKGSGKRIARNLYQFSALSDLKNNFSGHGFTGLNYFYASTNSAELQYWCSKASDNNPVKTQK